MARDDRKGFMRTRKCWPALGLVLTLAWPAIPAAMAQGRGLTPGHDGLGPTRWQARFERDTLPTAALAARASTPLWLLGEPARNLRLLGDYQSDLLRLGPAGGLRLTGGVLISLQPAGAGRPAADAAALMWSGSGYAGVGYSSAGAAGDWGFSADLGLTAWRFGSPSGPTGAGQAPSLRDMRLQPQLRLGMSLSF